jgi:hypothetical protein
VGEPDAAPANSLARRVDGVSACNHDGKATGTLRLNPVRAEVVCDHCAAILQVNPPSAALRFCDAVEMDQLFRRAQAKVDAEPSVEGTDGWPGARAPTAPALPL